MFNECNLDTCDKGYATLIRYKCFNSPNGSTQLIVKSSFINSLKNKHKSTANQHIASLKLKTFLTFSAEVL